MTQLLKVVQCSCQPFSCSGHNTSYKNELKAQTSTTTKTTKGTLKKTTTTTYTLWLGFFL